MDELGIYTVTCGAYVAVLGFAIMIGVMIYSKEYEPAGSLIVLRTSRYVVIAGLAMMFLGLAYMVAKALLTT
jgi:hypothetical protein